MRSALRRLGRARRGSTTVEFALVVFPFFLLTFGLAEIAMIGFAQTSLNYAVSETSRQIRTGQAQLGGITEAQIKRRRGVSIVWLIPIVAGLVAAFLGYKAITDKGPTITISFQTAEGLEAGKTAIKFKDVTVGTAEHITIADDLQSIVVTAQMVPGSDRYLQKDSRFWVVRPRIGTSGVSGLGTLFSGAYIALEPGTGESGREFVGLEQPPDRRFGAGLVELDDDLALAVDALVDLLDHRARNDRLRLARGAELDDLLDRAAFDAADRAHHRKHVALPPGRDQPDLGPVELDHRVGRDRGPVQQVGGLGQQLGQLDAGGGSGRLERVEEAPLEVWWGRGALAEVDSALLVEDDGIGEGAADVDSADVAQLGCSCVRLSQLPSGLAKLRRTTAISGLPEIVCGSSATNWK